jgi:hypothetical protein
MDDITTIADDPDAPPMRTPEIQNVLDTWSIAMLKAKDDRSRLMAITTFSKMLGRLDGDQCAAGAPRRRAWSMTRVPSAQ